MGELVLLVRVCFVSQAAIRHRTGLRHNSHSFLLATSTGHPFTLSSAVSLCHLHFSSSPDDCSPSKRSQGSSFLQVCSHCRQKDRQTETDSQVPTEEKGDSHGDTLFSFFFLFCGTPVSLLCFFFLSSPAVASSGRGGVCVCRFPVIFPGVEVSLPIRSHCKRNTHGL